MIYFIQYYSLPFWIASMNEMGLGMLDKGQNYLRQVYRKIADAVQVNVWSYDPESRRIHFLYECVRASESREKMGIPQEGVSPESYLYIVPQEEREKYRAFFQRMDEGAAVSAVDLRCCDPRENIDFYLYMAMYRFEDEQTHSSVIYGFTQDITLRRLSELKYQTTSQNIVKMHPLTTAVVHLNLSRNLCAEPQGLDANQFYPRVGTADELFQAIVRRIDDVDIREHLKGMLSRKWMIAAFYQGHSELSLDYPFLSEDGSRVWRSGRVLLMQNPVSGDVEAVAYNIDINDQKRREQIIDRVASDEFDFVGILNPQNSTFEFYYRKSGTVYSKMKSPGDYEKSRKIMRSAVVSPKDFEQWWQDTSIENICRQLQRNNHYTLSYESIEDDHPRRRLLTYCWLDSSKSDILIMHSDITSVYAKEQRQIQRTQRALEAAERANRTKAEFVSRVSHDIRSPIGILSNLVEFARQDMDDPKRLSEDLDKMRSVSSMLLSIVNDVLDAAKIENGKLELRQEPCTYQELMGDVTKIFAIHCEQKHQLFTLKEEGTEKLGRIYADKNRLRQLLANLVTNAVKYTPDGGRITVTVRVSEGTENSRLMEFIVEDTGIGMSSEFQKKMFQPFAREDENPYREEGAVGTGLGMSIVKSIAELMKGSLSVESTVGKGTRIRFAFLAEIAAEEESSAALVKEVSRPMAIRGKVLLAEDNEINGELLGRILKTMGVESDWVQNGAQALKRFCKSSPNEYGAILMDIQMPILNGYQSAEYIRLLRRADAGTIPIIALTADGFDEALERTRKSGMDAYLLKPVETAKLRGVLQSCFGAIHK